MKSDGMLVFPIGVDMESLLMAIEDGWDEQEGLLLVFKLANVFRTKKFAEDCRDFFNKVIEIHNETLDTTASVVL